MDTLRTDAVRRESLVRSVPFEIRDVGDGTGEGDGLTLTGLAAVWDSPTEIDSWEGTFTETIRKGAFRKTIREQTPVLQFDHGRHPLVGSIPIGRIDDLQETDAGLEVTARLSDNWLIEPVRDAIRDKAVNGMSFRFTVVREEWRDNAGKLIQPGDLDQLLWMPGDRGPLQRTLIELKCPELGPVVFPAYTDTVVGVRAREVADALAVDRDKTREIRRCLAQDAVAAEIPDDPALRREVAASLLFGRSSTPAAPPELGHPATSQQTLIDHGIPADEMARLVANNPDGAPLEREHPPAPSTTDAPPADGHPSSDPRTERMKSYLAEIGAGMDDVLASIEQKQENR